MSAIVEIADRNSLDYAQDIQPFTHDNLASHFPSQYPMGDFGFSSSLASHYHEDQRSCPGEEHSFCNINSLYPTVDSTIPPNFASPYVQLTNDLYTAEKQDIYNSNHGSSAPCVSPLFNAQERINLGYEDAQSNEFHTHTPGTTFDNGTYHPQHMPKFPASCPYDVCIAKTRITNFKNLSSWQTHFRRVHNKDVQCGICPMVFGTEAEAKRHRTSIHKTQEGTPIYECEALHCSATSKTFSRKDKFMEHRRRWHGEFYCKSPGCIRGPGNGFADAGALRRHSSGCLSNIQVAVHRS